MAKFCNCGRSVNMPFCDGSHTLSEAQYQERCKEFDDSPQVECSVCEWTGNDSDTWTIEGQMCCPECREPVIMLDDLE